MGCLSLQDPFPKGVIPLTAIEMTRSSKDNKFQVITGQRVFVFRTESEGEGQGPLGSEQGWGGQVSSQPTLPASPSPASSAGHVVLHAAVLPEGAAPPGPPPAPAATSTPPHGHAGATWAQGQGVCCVEPRRAGPVQE